MQREPATVLAVDSQTGQDLPEPWIRLEPGEGVGLEREAATEIGPGHELSGHRLTAISTVQASPWLSGEPACKGC